jgi:hypothetical protein
MENELSSRLLIIGLFDNNIREILKQSGCIESYLVNKAHEKALLVYFKNLESHEVDKKPDFLHKVQSGFRLSDADMSSVENFYDLYSDYTASDLKASLFELEKYVVSQRVKKALSENYDKNKSIVSDQELRVKLAEALDLNLSPTKISWNYGDYDDLHLFLSDDAKLEIIPSGYDLINESLSDGGYLKTNLCCFAANSGIGKSTAMLSESCHFVKNGYKVLYVNLGDMSPRSVFFRLLSTLSGVDSKIIRNEGYLPYLEQYKPLIQDNFRNIILEAGETDLVTLVTLIKKTLLSFKADVVVVDYDQNIWNSQNLSLYDFGGEVYTKLKGLAQSTNTLVFVASQTKIDAYKEEIIGKEFLSDSSKKVNNLDLLITFGAHKEIKTVGKMNLAKVRDGKSQWAHVKYTNNVGQIPVISKEEYEEIILKEKDKKEEVSKYFE